MTRDSSLLDSAVRRRLVERLSRSPHTAQRPRGGHTAAELAEAFGLHVTSVRFHLDQLLTAGVLTAVQERQEGAGRPRKVYQVSAGGTAPARAEASFAALAGLLAEAWGDDDTRRSPVEVGARWARANAAQMGLDDADRPEPARSAGAWLGKVGRMLDLLHDWGYHPRLNTDEDGHQVDIGLVACPFLDMARANPDLVCGIHHGLIAGSFEALGEHDVDVTLTPFVTSDTCTARVVTLTPFPSRKER